MKRSELKRLIREVIEEVSSSKFIAFKNHEGEWKIYQLGRNPNAKDWYIDIEDATMNSGFQSKTVEGNPNSFLYSASVHGIKSQIEDKENEHKKGDIDIINGETIVAVTGAEHDNEVYLKCASGNTYEVYAYPDENASAEISEIKLDKIIGKPIVHAQHEDKDSYGVTLTMKTQDGSMGEIKIVCDHNGYYGFEYGVTKRKS